MYSIPLPFPLPPLGCCLYNIHEVYIYTPTPEIVSRGEHVGKYLFVCKQIFQAHRPPTSSIVYFSSQNRMSNSFKAHFIQCIEVKYTGKWSIPQFEKEFNPCWIQRSRCPLGMQQKYGRSINSTGWRNSTFLTVQKQNV